MIWKLKKPEKKNAGQNPFEGHTESKHQDF